MSRNGKNFDKDIFGVTPLFIYVYIVSYHTWAEQSLCPRGDKTCMHGACTPLGLIFMRGRPGLKFTCFADFIQILPEVSPGMLRICPPALHSLTCIHLVALTWLHSHRPIQLVAFTWVHSLGCIHLVAFTWLHSIVCIQL